MPHSPQRRGREREKPLAKRMGGYMQPNSGALAGSKGDIHCGWLLVDSKLTDKQQYTIKAKDWHKHETDALKQEQSPVFSIKLGDGTELIVMRHTDFEAMRKVYEAHT